MCVSVCVCVCVCKDEVIKDILLWTLHMDGPGLADQ